MPIIGRYDCECQPALHHTRGNAGDKRLLVRCPGAIAVNLTSLARRFAQDIARDRDAACFQLANPICRQRTFVEFGELFHILRTCADQQFVDPGPHRRTVALAAGLGAAASAPRPLSTIVSSPATAPPCRCSVAALAPHIRECVVGDAQQRFFVRGGQRRPFAEIEFEMQSVQLRPLLFLSPVRAGARQAASRLRAAVGLDKREAAADSLGPHCGQLAACARKLNQSFRGDSSWGAM